MWEKLPERVAIVCAIPRGGQTINRPAVALAALAIFGVIGCGAAIAQKIRSGFRAGRSGVRFISSLGLSVGSGF